MFIRKAFHNMDSHKKGGNGHGRGHVEERVDIVRTQTWAWQGKDRAVDMARTWRRKWQ